MPESVFAPLPFPLPLLGVPAFVERAVLPAATGLAAVAPLAAFAAPPAGRAADAADAAADSGFAAARAPDAGAARVPAFDAGFAAVAAASVRSSASADAGDAAEPAVRDDADFAPRTLVALAAVTFAVVTFAARWAGLRAAAVRVAVFFTGGRVAALAALAFVDARVVVVFAALALVAARAVVVPAPAFEAAPLATGLVACVFCLLAVFTARPVVATATGLGLEGVRTPPAERALAVAPAEPTLRAVATVFFAGLEVTWRTPSRGWVQTFDMGAKAGVSSNKPGGGRRGTRMSREERRKTEYCINCVGDWP